MKKIIKNNIKVFVSIIISAVIFTGIGVYAAGYFAKDITYNKNGQATVEDALNDLYSKKGVVYETGNFTKYISYNNNYVTAELNFNKTYSEEDNARLIILSVTPSAPIYIHYSASQKIIGNKSQFYIFNMSGTASDSQNYTFNYAIIKYNQ